MGNSHQGTNEKFNFCNFGARGEASAEEKAFGTLKNKCVSGKNKEGKQAQALVAKP